MIIDQSNWPRKELYDFFSAVPNPHYMVTFRVDVTNLYRYVKQNNLSFYYALTWLSTRALNQIENFRYAVRNGQVELLEERIPSFTDLRKGSDCFYIVTLPCKGDLPDFCAEAARRSAAQTTLIDQSTEGDDLIYISCLPELDVMAVTNEGIIDPNENITRITWGKFTLQDGRRTLGYSMEVNHRFVDGYHLQKFYHILQTSIDELKTEGTYSI